MPAGNFSIYLYHDDPTDMRAQATIERTSQPLRGEFLRAAAISGAIMYRIDMRLPSVLTSLFAGQMQVGLFAGLLALLSGEGELLKTTDQETYPWVPDKLSRSSERRRFSLKINDDVNAGLLMSILGEVSTRRRNSLLRELVIAGCAIHDLDARFVKLLSSMPEPPVSIQELQLLTDKMLGLSTLKDIPAVANGGKSSEQKPASGGNTVKENMKKIF
ncbi:TPA: ABC transporter [Kluyvera ascorbata]|uniref:ABC transporter n=1 Tax=Kluyvera genomosp. 2 TaxID=2774054 RepID=A0A2T2XVC0_9ENTR|nr:MULTISPECIES: plasmid partitioning/stability family protein [Enterobacteriaceae]HAT3921009.1 ABC transporter [Kluyvera ascorbata]PSR44225.1 ABC transporter [Kluyvera genomosp. 2]BBQ86655.1 mediator of plasmid stability [Klebsiella sp. WP3-W18-ESBL-02]BBR23735.1 mediator of plasmid stability [Klebsiella sp. WP3-S18-ESBL-05]HAT3945939.1 ABC transporter [Kluyvera ascorbata]